MPLPSFDDHPLDDEMYMSSGSRSAGRANTPVPRERLDPRGVFILVTGKVADGDIEPALAAASTLLGTDVRKMEETEFALAVETLGNRLRANHPALRKDMFQGVTDGNIAERMAVFATAYRNGFEITESDKGGLHSPESLSPSDDGEDPARVREEPPEPSAISGDTSGEQEVESSTELHDTYLSPANVEPLVTDVEHGDRHVAGDADVTEPHAAAGGSEDPAAFMEEETSLRSEPGGNIPKYNPYAGNPNRDGENPASSIDVRAAFFLMTGHGLGPDFRILTGRGAESVALVKTAIEAMTGQDSRDVNVFKVRPDLEERIRRGNPGILRGIPENDPSQALDAFIRKYPKGVPLSPDDLGPLGVGSGTQHSTSQGEETMDTTQDQSAAGSATQARARLLAETSQRQTQEFIDHLKAAREHGDPIIPAPDQGYADLPAGVPVLESYEDRRIDAMAPGNASASVTCITDEELLEEARSLAIYSSDEKDDDRTYPAWINKPDVWPAFIGFPMKRDLDAIHVAEQNGKLTPERKDRFNDHFAKLGLLMQERARQLDRWIYQENEAFAPHEKKKIPVLRNPRKPRLRKALDKLKTARENLDATNERSMEYRGVPYADQDPFRDIKWAVLLDPYASPDDPRLAHVARWGHNMARTHDGGMLRVNDDGMRIPLGEEGTQMAGALAVAEAVERGWTSINITGNHAFVQGAREAAIKAGLGAKIVTTKGFAMKSKPEFIMPKPPKLASVSSDSDKLQNAHDDLSSGEGMTPDKRGKPPAGKAGADRAPENRGSKGSKGRKGEPGKPRAPKPDMAPEDPFAAAMEEDRQGEGLRLADADYPEEDRRFRRDEEPDFSPA